MMLLRDLSTLSRYGCGSKRLAVLTLALLTHFWPSAFQKDFRVPIDFFKNCFYTIVIRSSSVVRSFVRSRWFEPLLLLIWRCEFNEAKCFHAKKLTHYPVKTLRHDLFPHCILNITKDILYILFVIDFSQWPGKPIHFMLLWLDTKLDVQTP